MEKIDFPSGGSLSSKGSGNNKVKKGKESPLVFKSLVESETLTANAVKGVEGFDEDADLEDLLDDVHQNGERLLEEMSLSAVMAYKKSVRNFIHYITQQSLSVESIDGVKFSKYKPANKQKRYTLIRVIDDKLEKLASGILQNQLKQLDLLAKVEEINGLLIDMTR